MSTTATKDGAYVLGRTDQEYDRLRAQARVWEAATGRLLDRVVVAPIGVPGGTDVAGRLENMSSGGSMLVAVYRSLLPAAVVHGLTTDGDVRCWQELFCREMIDHADDPLLWPLLLGVWKRKAGGSR